MESMALRAQEFGISRSSLLPDPWKSDLLLRTGEFGDQTVEVKRVRPREISDQGPDKSTPLLRHMHPN